MSRRHHALTWVLVLVGLAVTQVLQSHTPAPDDASRPYERTVAVGEVAALRAGDLVVTGLRGGTSAVVDPGSGFVTPGVVVVADLTWTPSTTTAALRAGQVEGSDGRSWSFGARGSRGGIACQSSVPGITVVCAVLVELPVDALPGATLHLRADADDRYDTEAVVTLGVTAEQAAGWAKATAPVKVEAPHPAGLKP